MAGDHACRDVVLDDAAVIARVLAGDRQLFALLVERYQNALYRFAVSIVLDHDVAADMVQDAFVRAYVGLASCRDRTCFGAWIFRTLRNRCLDHVKDVRRRTVRLDEALAVPDAADGPGALAERVRLREHIGQALAALPYAQREAFVMHCVEELPYDEMAGMLGVSVSALKMRVLRARETLGSALRCAKVTDPVPARLSITRG